jgi:hypothetical protein
MVRVSFEIPDEALRSGEAPRHRPLVTYAEAAELLGGISKDAVRGLVERGILDRPEWSRGEVRVAVVTTASVYREAGWPIEPLAMVVPIGSVRSR